MITDGTNNMVMPVAPMNGGYGYGNAGGMFGGSGDWLGILFLIALCNGGWGGFGGGFGGAGNMMLGYDFPWLLNGQQGVNNNVSDGFRSAQISDGITSVRDGLSALSTQLCGCCGDTQMALANGFAGVNTNLCNGFAGVNASVTGAQNALAQQMYTNQIADLERSFAAQTANTNGLNNLNSAIQNGCYENRAATADVKYTIAQEACASRATSTANTQAILDKLCQLELDTYKQQVDAKNDTIAQLRQEVLYARGQASQVDQTARILAGQAAEIDGVYNRLKNCPVGTVPVYGNQAIFSCPQNANAGCGCGCNGSF